MNNKIITQISLKADEELIKRTRTKTRRNYYMVGKTKWTNSASKGEKPKWSLSGIDFIDEFTDMSNKERSLIKLMKDNFTWDDTKNSYNYIVNLHPYSLEFDKTTETFVYTYKTFLAAYSLLFKKNLMRRISKNNYMLNPSFFIVTGELTSYYEQTWADSL